MEQISYSSNAQSELNRNLNFDLMNLKSCGLTDHHTYQSKGRKIATMSMQSNMLEKSTHTSGGAYQMKSKKAMASRFSAMQQQPSLPAKPNTTSQQQQQVQLDLSTQKSPRRGSLRKSLSQLLSPRRSS